jgi:precorrin-4 methylase
MAAGHQCVSGDRKTMNKKGCNTQGRKNVRKKALFLLLTMGFLSILIAPSESPALSIGGVVRQPLNLTTEDMASIGHVELKLTEITRDGRFGGVFLYRGVSLRALLQLATVQKEISGFSKSIDLAVVVHNRDGKIAVLSWGEIFYRNPGDVVIAVSATPVMPGVVKGCGECHGAEIYQPALDQLSRKIGFPKLIIANDFYTDRCLEDVTHIEVVELKRSQAKKQGEATVASKFSIIDAMGKSTEIIDLAGHRRVSVVMKEVGSGRGYHGVKRYEGVSLRDLLEKTHGREGVDKAILVVSPDGYQSLVSYGEVFLSSTGERIIITDPGQGTGQKENAKFSLVLPDDNSADRMVKNIDRIEILSLKAVPRVYVIGFGCGDTSLITLEAISHMGKAGAFVGAKDFTERFAKYMGDKPVLFDPFTSWEPVYKKNHPDLSDEEIRKRTTELRATEIKSIWDTLKAGKSVAILEPGDPTIYGGWENWLLPEFAGQIEIVAGMSSFSAANAMIGKNVALNRNSMVLTTPWALQAHVETVKAMAQAGDTMAIFMGLKELKGLMPILEEYYPATAPVTIAYKAGISHEKRLVRTRLDQLLSTVAKEDEQFLGLIYVGP